MEGFSWGIIVGFITSLLLMLLVAMYFRHRKNGDVGQAQSIQDPDVVFSRVFGLILSVFMWMVQRRATPIQLPL
uniref:ATP synthase F0 subunit 8 n=1 Tax=Acrobeloides nanus TaxID=290746 RepID=A0A914DDX5_9BILA